MRHASEIYETLFDSVAGVYDSPEVDFFRPVGRRLIELACPRQGDTVLDVGCGRGAALFPAAEAVGPHGTAIGIDVSMAMVNAVNKECVLRGYHQAHAMRMDGQRPGFTRGAFDAIVGSMSIHMLDDVNCAYANYRRILKESGKLAGSVLGTDETPEPRIFGLKSIARMAETYTRSKAIHVGDFDSAKSIYRRLHCNGFINVHIVDESIRLEADSPKQFINWTWSHGMRLLWQRVPDDGRPYWAGEIEAEVLEYADNTGKARIPIPIRYFIAQQSSREIVEEKTG